MTQNKQPIQFEEAFTRLEEILEKMNSGTVTLDNSLKLYEEADTLLIHCQKKLNEAEKKIETLIKNREGELEIDTNKSPKTSPFSPTTPES